MWGIEPQLLCDRHLLGEHAEMHQAVGTIHNHPHGEAIVEGHAAKRQLDTSKIRERHDELAEEIDQRGMTHDSPMGYDDVLDLGRIDRTTNRAELKARCGACRKRIETEEKTSNEA